jgi:hypothetical protein
MSSILVFVYSHMAVSTTTAALYFSDLSSNESQVYNDSFEKF